MMFKIGDKVIGLACSPYVVTTANTILVVTEIYGRHFTGVLIKHPNPNFENHLNYSFSQLYMDHFALLKNAKRRNLPSWF